MKTMESCGYDIIYWVKFQFPLVRKKNWKPVFVFETDVITFKSKIKIGTFDKFVARFSWNVFNGRMFCFVKSEVNHDDNDNERRPFPFYFHWKSNISFTMVQLQY